ncbi:hypothetical protein BD413DRAFT_538792 [Trametes elegans]|nr:hypothetical protein BD413DRAFT_538792 [Trametes elegans]
MHVRRFSGTVCEPSANSVARAASSTFRVDGVARRSPISSRVGHLTCQVCTSSWINGVAFCTWTSLELISPRALHVRLTGSTTLPTPPTSPSTSTVSPTVLSPVPGLTASSAPPSESTGLPHSPLGVGATKGKGRQSKGNSIKVSSRYKPSYCLKKSRHNSTKSNPKRAKSLRN